MFLMVKNLSKSFGGVKAISDLDVFVNEGEVVGLIGPNGSGKTTLFNLICGVFKSDTGEITFEGTEITGFKPHRVCQSGICRTFQLTKPFDEMTVLENVLVGRLYGGDPLKSTKSAEKDCKKIIESVGLQEKIKSMAGTLGIIDRKKMEIARALATKPKLLLLDEVMCGLTTTEMKDALKLLRTINESGITLIVVEHVMNVILDISTRLIVLNYGKKIAEGPPKEVVRERAVIEAYLGE